MKKLTILCFCIAAVLLGAGEKEALLKKFQQEDAEADKRSQEALTTLEMTSAAGNSAAVAEQQLFRALDYKLRRTSDSKQRLQLISDFYDLAHELRKIYNTPREGKGSIIGLHIYSHAASIIRQHIAVLLLDPVSEKRWLRIKDAALVLGKKTISFNQGKAEYFAITDNIEDIFESTLFPQDTFTYKNRDFAVIRTDIQFAGNDDFSTVYLCELVNGKLLVHTKCEFPLISKWDIKGDTFTFYDQKEVQLIDNELVYRDTNKVQKTDLRKSPTPAAK